MNPIVKLSDWELIKLLMENARMPISEIARKFGVSDTAIRKRIKKLEEEGVILKYTIEINPRKLGFNIIAIIGLDTKPEKYLSTIEKLKKIDEVISLYSSSGDHMIMAECWFKNSTELSNFIKMLENIDGVTKICPAIILEKIK